MIQGLPSVISWKSCISEWQVLKRLNVSFGKGGNYGRIFIRFWICYRFGTRLRIGIDSR